jgi:hypothetical protein
MTTEDTQRAGAALIDETGGAAQPSRWQQRIEGVWYGRPGVFDAGGARIGFNKVFRSSRFEHGRTTYTMDTTLEATGPLRYRLEARDFAFAVQDSDQDRIYLGPDFIGAGHPTGALVDAHYYSPQWMADLRTMVHLPDAETQVYSSLLYDGPTIIAVFNGLYRVAFDYDTNPETRARIDAFVAEETARSEKPHVLPAKQAGTWRGVFECYDAAGAKGPPLGVMLRYEPLSLTRARCTLTTTSDIPALNRAFTFERSRFENRHTFEGPDLWGNGIAYGRALYTTQHVYGRAEKIRGREFLIDDAYTMSGVWQWLFGDAKAYTTFGLLAWQHDG